MANQTWEAFYGDYVWVWKGGEWKFVKNTAVDVENEVKLVQTADGLALVGHAIDAAGNVFNSNLEVTARQIRGEVETAEGKLSSVIEQTATYIRSMVTDQVNGLSSVIEQTASQIRTEVSNSISNVHSSITQQADRISLVVEGTGANAHIKPASIVASINNGASTIKLSADHIDIDGLVNRLRAIEINVSALEVTNGIDCKHIDCTTIDCTGIGTNTGDVYCGGTVETWKLKVNDYAATWKSKTIVTYNLSESHAFMYRSGSNTPTILGKLVTSQASSTIYYLGR